MLPEPLHRAVRRVALRVRAQRAADAATTAGLAALGIAALALLAAKTGALEDAEARWLLAIAGLTPIAAALFAALRPVPRLVAARLLDRAHPTRGRIAAALELAEQAADDPWTRAALDDAAAHAGTIRADRAAPFRAPRDLGPLAGIALAVAALAALEIPRRIEQPVARGITPVVLHEDDLDAYEERVRAITSVPDVAPEVLASAAELNRVLEDLADRRIDREETLRRLAELEARIEATRPAAGEHLRDELRAMGQELRRSELARDLAEAMREGDAVRAELAMRELASRLRDEQRPDRGELERLRRALQDAAREREDAGEEELERREEEMQRLLRQREQASAGEREQQERLLEQRRRELDRLRREHQARQEARRELDRLRRELEDAAQDLERQDQQGSEEASESMDRAAEDLNRMARQQLTQEQQEDIARQARELRELIRRQRQQQAQGGGEGGEGSQGQGSQGSQGRAPSAMDRFVLRARGQGEGEGMPIAAPGTGQEGQGQSAGGGQQQGAQGGQGGAAEGQGAESQGGQGAGEEQEMLVLGQGGDAQLEIPGLGGTQGEPGGAGGTGEGRMPGGGAGDEHAPGALDDPTQLGGAGRTVQVRGEARRGLSRPEVIRTAAQRGFATREYRDVYADYADHAEEVIERDRVPPGYRFYVQRYFQLIRPRDGREGQTE